MAARTLRTHPAWQHLLAMLPHSQPMLDGLPGSLALRLWERLVHRRHLRACSSSPQQRCTWRRQHHWDLPYVLSVQERTRHRLWRWVDPQVQAQMLLFYMRGCLPVIFFLRFLRVWPPRLRCTRAQMKAAGQRYHRTLEACTLHFHRHLQALAPVA